MYNYEELVWAILKELIKNNSISEEAKLLQGACIDNIQKDQTGEGFIYEMLAWFMQENDFEHEDDFGELIEKTGFTVDDFMGSTRLRRGLWKAFQIHYPDKLERPEYRLLFVGLDKNFDRTVSEVIAAVATVRGCSANEVSGSDLSEAMEINREILDLYKELGGCASLAIAIPEDDDYPDKAYLGIRACDPNQQGAMIRYGDGGYDLFQLVFDIPAKKVLGNKVAACLSLEKAKAAGQLLFDEDSKAEKTLRIPLSVSSYVESIYPFEDFRIINTEGRDEKLSGDQEFFRQRIDEFFDGMSRESRDFLRDLKL